MRILIDTNILIPMEDSSLEIDSKLAELSRLASGKHQILYHPASKDDIKRDKNENRKKSILARLNKYIELESPPALDENTEVEFFGTPKKDNDRVDNLILFSLHRNCVHWLITHDQGIHKKAREIGESDRVYDVTQAILALREIDQEHNNRLHPSIQNIPCHSLNIKDIFFDSLRSDYKEFNSWFDDKCCKEGRFAWVCINDSNIDALCIYKIERNPIVTTDKRGLSGKSLKLCTFKVNKTGFKIGELFLKQTFNYAVDNKIENIYLTVAPKKQEMLENLLLDFGFVLYGVDSKGVDNVYLKVIPSLPPKTDDAPLNYLIKYYPRIKLHENKGILVPILPQYHKVLFPELEIQSDLFNGSSNSAGNSIKQAYICASPINSISSGDILFFYRTKDRKSVTTYGVVDQFIIESEADKIYQWVAKRTVYSYSEILEMNGNAKKVILFRLVGHLNVEVSYDKLKQLGIVTGSIQSVTTLSKENTIKLMKEANINDCIISN